MYGLKSEIVYFWKGAGFISYRIRQQSCTVCDLLCLHPREAKKGFSTSLSPQIKSMLNGNGAGKGSVVVYFRMEPVEP